MDSKKPETDETRKLTYVVICLSMFVFVVVGLGPMI
jgi:hypothetical protein